MYRLGLTGSIATGKSTALAAFADLGIPTFSSDEAVHALYESEAVEPVGRVFPGVVLDGRIDRSALAAQLVEHPQRLRDLEAIVHPMVRVRIKQFLSDAAAGGADLAVVDIPLLFETGFDYGLDGVAVTVVDTETQRERALARPGMTVDKLRTILARQLPQDEKVRRADFVIDSSVPIAAMKARVAEIVGAIRAGKTE
jgi:dephospho-CoA kinase